MKTTWGCALLGALLISACFRPTPCTRDSDCGGPGGACDPALGFCVTTDAGGVGGGGGGGSGVDGGSDDAGLDGGSDDAGLDGGSDDAGLDGGSDDAGLDGGSDDAGLDGGSDAGADDGGALALTVTATSPLNLATKVLAATRPSARFSETMNSTTLNPTTFTLMQGTNRIDGGVSLDGTTNTATFTPTVPLSSNRLYTASITTAVRSLNGLALSAEHTWRFTTAFLELGTAQTCSVLGASVTNTGNTSLSGDLVVSSGTPLSGGATITVGGSSHLGDAAATQARANLQLAYDAAASMTPTNSIAALDGQTLTAGVYSSNAVALSLNTVLTLDAENDPNAIFLFQVDAALNTGANTSSVVLIRGAQASNVYWQVSGAVTLGANSSFTGTVMGLAAITVGASTIVEGHMLSLNGVVTLATNTITSQ